MRKVKPKNYVTGRWVLTINTNTQGNFLKAEARWVLRGFQDKHKDCQQTDSPASTRSVAIVAQATSCSNVRGVFPEHELFWFCLVQVSTTQFCSFSPVLMARVSDGTDVPVSPLPASSSNVASPNGSLPDLEGTGYRACTMEEKINEMFIQIAKLPLFMQSISRFESCVQTLHQTMASYDAKITNSEQIVSSLPALVTMLETNATSVSSGSGSASSWNLLGHSDGSTATGSLGPHGQGSFVDNRNRRRRLDTFSSLEDEHARSAVLVSVRTIPRWSFHVDQ